VWAALFSAGRWRDPDGSTRGSTVCAIAADGRVGTDVGRVAIARTEGGGLARARHDAGTKRPQDEPSQHDAGSTILLVRASTASSTGRAQPSGMLDSRTKTLRSISDFRPRA